MKWINRRDFFRLSLGFSALLPFLGHIVFADIPGSNRMLLTQTITAYLDTLIPRDETPSAVDLGGLEHIFAKINGNRQFKVLVYLAVAWLDAYSKREHGRGFAKLNEKAREQVVSKIAQSEQGQTERLFFDQMRDIVFRHYYSQPVVWPSLGFAGPPQPDGFPDHAQPPRR